MRNDAEQSSNKIPIRFLALQRCKAFLLPRRAPLRAGHHFGHQLGLMGSAASPEKYFAPSLDCRITT